MPIARLCDIDCYYEIHGSGTPLVLIAGLAGDSQSWRPVFRKLAKRFKVIVFDNRGVGRTGYPRESFRIATMARDTVALLNKLRIEKADILGHSMGGCIAQEIAIEYPEKVGRLVLASTCAAVPEKSRALLLGLLQALQSGKNYESFVREFLRLLFTPGYLAKKEIIEPVVKCAVDYPFPVTAEGFRLQLEALSGFNSLDRLRDIKAPTLVIAGRRDVLVPLKETQSLAEGIPCATNLYLENAAHSFQVEHRGLFIKYVTEFLDRTGSDVVYGK